MSYRYETARQMLFDDEGQRMFLKVRDFVNKALRETGAVRMEEAMRAAGGGDSWTMLACVDRLVELKEIREIRQEGVPGQHRIFVRA